MIELEFAGEGDVARVGRAPTRLADPNFRPPEIQLPQLNHWAFRTPGFGRVRTNTCPVFFG
jgi:hypothetical protein